MSFTSKGAAEIIAAGQQNTMLVVDLNKGEVVKQVWTLLSQKHSDRSKGANIIHLRCQRNIITAS